MKTTPESAVSLLERSDPIAQEQMLDPDDLRVRVAALIADDPSPAPMVAGGSPRRRNPSRVAAVAIAAVIAFTVVLLARPGSHHQGGGLLSEPAALAAEQPATLAPAGSFYYLDEVESQPNLSAPTAQAAKHPFLRFRVRWWVAANGSGRVAVHVSSGGIEPFSKRFAAGGYDAVAYPTRAEVGVRQRVVPEVGVSLPLFEGFAPERLPSDPSALRTAIRSEIVKAAHEQRYGLFGEKSVPESAKELQIIAFALQDPMDSPALRGELFRVAGEVPGITVQRHVTDPLGRSGEAITASEGVAVEAGRVNPSARELFSVIFDPTTTQVLAETQYPSDHPADDDLYTVFTGHEVVPSDTIVPSR